MRLSLVRIESMPLACIHNCVKKLYNEKVSVLLEKV